MAQLTYAETMDVAFPGMKADLTPDYVRSYHNAEASAEMPFGIAVAQGANADAAILPVDANSKLIGVVLHSHEYEAEAMGTVGLKPKQVLNVLAQGTVWVKVEEAVAVGDRCFVRHTASGGNTQKGSFRKSADTATAVELKGARYLTAAASGGVAQVQVDFNVVRATQA